MKAKGFFGFGTAALLLALGLVLAGCPTGGGGGGDDDDDIIKDPGAGLFSVSGSFAKSAAAGGGTVTFDLTSDDVIFSPSASILSRSIHRAAAAEGYAISGLLQDGDLTIRLKGSYDPGTGNWSVSAKSSIIVYTLDGSVDSAGVSHGSSATIAVKVGEEWVPYIFPVTESTAVSISGEADDGVAGWLPAFAYGAWHISANWGGGYSQTMTCIISDWKIKVTGTTTTPDNAIPYEQTLTVIEYGGSGSTFEALCCYPEYVVDAANLARAFAAYLGINAGDIRVLTEEPVTGTLMPPGRWIYMSSSDSIWFGGFTEADFNKLNVFWATGGWETWAAANGVTPENRYEKYKVSFPNNTTMDVTQMVEAGTDPWNYTYSFDSLAALKLATLVEVSEVMSFTR